MGNQKPIKSMIIIQVTLFNEGKPNLEQTARCLQDTKQSPNLTHLLTKINNCTKQASDVYNFQGQPSKCYLPYLNDILITFYKCLIGNYQTILT